MNTTHTVHLVDASPYIFRAFFSIPASMTNPEGQSINAVYGFSAFLRLLVEKEGVTHIALTFDGSLTTSFRNDFYPEYKAQRELPPEDLKAQLDACKAVGEAMGMATFIDSRYEADDLIATLCRPLAAEGHRVVIVTSDKDLTQLVDERVSLFDFAKDERYGPAEVVEKFGVRPGQIADYLGLAGDSVDNIPGVKGVGKKTAVALLNALGSLEEIYQRLDAVPELPIRGAKSVARKLTDQRDMAELSKRLATVADDAPASAGLEDLVLRERDTEALAALAEALGFDPSRDRRRRSKNA